MSQMALDPISYSDALQNAGMPKRQADVIAKTQQAGMDRLLESRELATRRDLQFAILESESRLRLELANLRADLIRWMVGLVAGLGAFLVAVMAWLK